jgi:hypothetical protein
VFGGKPWSCCHTNAKVAGGRVARAAVILWNSRIQNLRVCQTGSERLGWEASRISASAVARFLGTWKQLGGLSGGEGSTALENGVSLEFLSSEQYRFSQKNAGKGKKTKKVMYCLLPPFLPISCFYLPSLLTLFAKSRNY